MKSVLSGLFQKKLVEQRTNIFEYSLMPQMKLIISLVIGKCLPNQKKHLMSWSGKLILLTLTLQILMNVLKATIIAIKRLYATTVTVHLIAFAILGTQEMARIVKISSGYFR